MPAEKQGTAVSEPGLQSLSHSVHVPRPEVSQTRSMSHGLGAQRS